MMHDILIKDWLTAKGWAVAYTANRKLIGSDCSTDKIISYQNERLSMQWGHQPKQFDSYIEFLDEGCIESMLWFLDKIGPKETELDKELVKALYDKAGFIPRYRAGKVYIQLDVGYIICDTAKLVYGVVEQGKILQFNGNIEEDNLTELMVIITQMEAKFKNEVL
ncbi:MAG: hypothetical protein WCS17_04445 [Prevotella sp.]